MSRLNFLFAGAFESWRSFLEWGSFISVAILAGSFVVLPFIVNRLPADYFIEGRARHARNARSVASTVIRNLLGALLFVTGVAMLVVPGPGLLTIVAALAVAELPGKTKLMRALLSSKHILASLNHIRSAANKPPFRLQLTYSEGRAGQINANWLSVGFVIVLLAFIPWLVIEDVLPAAFMAFYAATAFALRTHKTIGSCVTGGR